MKIVEGNLITLAKQGRFDVIVHGCNCFNSMGAGIARQITLEFPAAYDIDRATTRGCRFKLGTISMSSVGSVVIVNAYTQFHPGPDLDYDAVRSCFRLIRNLFVGKRIGFPKIGAGIGGGDWDQIAAIIEKEMEFQDITLVVLPGGNHGCV